MKRNKEIELYEIKEVKSKFEATERAPHFDKLNDFN